MKMEYWPRWAKKSWLYGAGGLAFSTEFRARQELSHLFVEETIIPSVEGAIERAEDIFTSSTLVLTTKYKKIRALRDGLYILMPGENWDFFNKMIADLRQEIEKPKGLKQTSTRVYKSTHSVPFKIWPLVDREKWDQALLLVPVRGRLFGDLAPGYLKALQNAYGRFIKFRESALINHDGIQIEFLQMYIQDTIVSDKKISSVYRTNLVFRLWRTLRAFRSLENLEVSDGFTSEWMEEAIDETDYGFSENWEEEEEISLKDPFRQENFEIDDQEDPLNWLLHQAMVLENLQKSEKSKVSRIVPPQDLFRLGMDLCKRASKLKIGTPAAVDYRNGLLIALLALRPVRISNLIELEFGEEIIDCGIVNINKQKISWPCQSMKNRHSYEVSIPKGVIRPMETYIGLYRNVLAGNHETKKLWLTREGGSALSIEQARQVIKRTTKVHLGVDVCPHLFRDSNASWIAENMPEDSFWLIPETLAHINSNSSRTYRKNADQVFAQQAVNKQLLKKMPGIIQ
ncbi:MAG: tyrosine-type recombinase/integrase [Halopseudomonas aestusnigri]